METLHPNSHFVYIRRKALFDTSERPELDEYFSGSSVSVGSYYAKDTARPASGLLIPEENILMPHVLGIPKDDRDFRTQVNDYFSGINSKIPPTSVPARDEDGLKLQIGLYLDNNKPISEDNLPLNPEQYIRYRQIIGHPWVGFLTEEDNAMGNQLKRFYVYDPNQIQTTTLTVNEKKDIALTKYLSVKENLRKVRMYLTLLGVNTGTLRKGEELTKLRELAETHPADFIKVAGDKDLELKYMIEELVNYKVLTRIGDRLLSDNTEIGRNVLEAVLYLKDSHNTQLFTSLRARLNNEWTKNSVSVEVEEDLKPKDDFRETDEQLKIRLEKQNKQTASVIDRTKGKGTTPEPEKALGIDIQTEPEPEVVDQLPGGLGDIDAGTTAEDNVGEPVLTEEYKAPDDNRAKEPTPDSIK